MSETISGTYTTGIVLNPATPLVTITGTGNISGATAFQDGYATVYGIGGTAFTVTNNGLVNDNLGSAIGNYDGIVLGNNGTLDNSAITNAGTIITPEGTGIRDLNTGTILNSGTILAGSQGIELDSTNSGLVQNSGLIDVQQDPIDFVDGISAGDGTIENLASGTINVLTGQGMLMSSGSIYNAGIVNAKDGVFFDLEGVFTNTGSVLVAGNGVDLATYGSVLNSGVIASTGGSYAAAVRIDGDFGGNGGTISNTSTGTISTTGGYGIELLNENASVINAGTVTGGEAGIAAKYARAFITNSGFVAGGDTGPVTVYGEAYTGSAIDLLDGGKVTNLAGGTISGTNSGILATDVSEPVQAFVTNSGVIEEFGNTIVGGSFPGIPAAVDLFAGGKVVNSSTGSIIAGGAGVFATGGFVVNSGLISGDLVGIFLDGVVLNSATVSNRATGVIDSADGTGIYLNAQFGTVNNIGTINAVDGVGFNAIGNFTNEGRIFATIGAQIISASSVQNSGSIFASDAGIIAYAATSIDNALHKILVTGSSSFVLADGMQTLAPAGIILLDGGSIANGPTALIEAKAGYGIDLANGGTVENDGRVIGKSAGVLAAGTISITNSVTGTISGHVGVLAGSDATVDSSGTIIGVGGVAVAFTGTGDLLVDRPGAVFTGIAKDSGAGGVVELGSGGLTGTIAAFNAQFQGFSTIDVDSGASWVLGGTVATLLNDGTLAIDSGSSLDVTGDIDANSTGIFLLSGNASLDVAAALGTDVKIQFLNAVSGGTLAIENAASFGVNIGLTNYAGPLLEDFKAGDVIDLTNLVASGLTLNYDAGTGNLQITASGGGVVASLQFQNSSLGAGGFTTTADSGHGTLLTLT